jgi:rhodanese-related sulfurtransferase
MNIRTFTVLLLSLVTLPIHAEGPEGEVLIRDGVRTLSITLDAQTYHIQRNQDPNRPLTPLYTNTTVGTLQPIQLAPGVETIGELELIDYLQRMQTDDSVVLIDTRPHAWFERMRIPGAINVPPDTFDNELTAIQTLERLFNVTTREDGELDFSQAKIVIGYCNGHFCGYTPGAIRHADYALLKLGYPAQKIKYYRGGMQAWTSVGLTVIGNEAF